MATESGTENAAVDNAGLNGKSGADARGVSAEVVEDSAWRYDAVRELLRTVPWEFQFFQAVRLLERLYPERATIGRFARPEVELARFGATPRMAFPPSQIFALALAPRVPPDLRTKMPPPPLMLINFLGMFGPQGVLPLYYTELIIERLRHKDRALGAFLDMFNHRMVSLFYQSWEKYRVTVAYERDERDRFSHVLLDNLGLGTNFLQQRQIIEDESFLFYSGLLGIHSRPAGALRQVLWDYFDVPVEIEQLVGAWHPLVENDQCKFDKANTYSEQVGQGAIVGDEIWDQQSGVRVRLGPLTLGKYLDFLPTGTAYEPLRAILRFFSGWEIDYEVQLVLDRREVPGCRLGDESENGPKLGWVSWAKHTDLPGSFHEYQDYLKRPLMNRDPDDTILRV